MTSANPPEAAPSREGQPSACLPSTAPTCPAGRRLSSRSLLAGAREVVIDHHGHVYHLRLTRNDRLILTQ